MIFGTRNIDRFQCFMGNNRLEIVDSFKHKSTLVSISLAKALSDWLLTDRPTKHVQSKV